MLNKAINNSILKKQEDKIKVKKFFCNKCGREIPRGKKGRTCKECRNKSS